MQDVNKKIIWLADFDLHQAAGGAQRSDKIIIDYGKFLGLNILKVNKDTFGNHINIHEYDILISSNIQALLHLNPWLLSEISKHKYHVRLEHDSNTYLTQESRKILFSNCKKTVFLTEFHHKYFLEEYGNIFNNVEIITDPIDTDKFYSYNQNRENAILYAGYMHPLKGSYEFFDYVLQNPNVKFVVAGWSNYPTLDFLSKSINNVEYLGIVQYEQMPDIYNKYSSFFYNPNLREPFCRSFAEALLCGCKIICSKLHNIGAYHDFIKYGKNEFIQKCKNAHIEFWQKI